MYSICNILYSGMYVLNILNMLYSGCTQYAICNILGCTQYAWWPELSGEGPTAVHSEVYLVTFSKKPPSRYFCSVFS